MLSTAKRIDICAVTVSFHHQVAGLELGVAELMFFDHDCRARRDRVVCDTLFNIIHLYPVFSPIMCGIQLMPRTKRSGDSTAVGSGVVRAALVRAALGVDTFHA